MGRDGGGDGGGGDGGTAPRGGGGGEVDGGGGGVEEDVGGGGGSEGVVVVAVHGGVEAEEGDLRFEVLDLPLQLLLGLARLLVALLACASVQLLVLLPARLAPHSRSLRRLVAERVDRSPLSLFFPFFYFYIFFRLIIIRPYGMMCITFSLLKF